MQKIALSVIVVNFESRAYLEKCLLSVFAKIDSRVSFEVLVVNNGLVAEVEGLTRKFPGIKIIQNGQNSGFGGANNLGAKEAKGEVLFFLNPDAEIVSADIFRVMDELQSDSALGILGSKLITTQGKVQKWIVGGEVSLWNVLKNNFKLSRDEKYWQSQNKREVFWVAGTAMFIRKDLFFLLGGFDERFFLYFEDVDLCQRARLLGKKVVYYPQFSALHHGGKSFSPGKKQKKSYYQSQDYYFKKHRGVFEGLLLKILRFFSF